jgi:hypothetical protein
VVRETVRHIQTSVDTERLHRALILGQAKFNQSKGLGEAPWEAAEAGDAHSRLPPDASASGWIGFAIDWLIGLRQL